MSHDIVLASNSNIKLQTLKSYCEKFGMNVTSEYNSYKLTVVGAEQPFGLDNTVTCAKNRMIAVNTYLKSVGHPDDTPRYIVSIENGVYEADTKEHIYKDFCIVLIKDRVTSRIYTNRDTALNHALKIPMGSAVMDEIAGSKLENGLGYDTTFGSILSGWEDVPSNNWMEHMCGASRQSQITTGLDSIFETVMRETIMSHVRLINGYPKENILFQDYMPVLYDFTVRSFLTHLIMKEIPDDVKVDIIAGPEMRGILFGNSLADLLKLGFVPLRKKGKLPPPTLHKSYGTEYNDNNTLEIDASDCNPLVSMKGLNVVVVDDVRATGGSLKAAIDLVEEAGGKVVYWVTINDVEPLREKAKEVLAGYKGSVVFE